MRFKKTKNLLLALLFVVPSYVLPYPGLMPGNKLYRVKEIIDCIGQYWAFGSFARHSYELKLADKKLIEAKTLFDYQQYPLALQALSVSNDHFQKAAVFLRQAAGEGKNIAAKATRLQAASKKHQEVLQSLLDVLPEKFVWQPEKASAETIQIKKMFQEAIESRVVIL